MQELSQATDRGSLLDSFESIASLGPDALEAVPVFLQAAWKTSATHPITGSALHPLQVVFALESSHVAQSSALRHVKAYGPCGATMTVIWLAHHLDNRGLTPLGVALALMEDLIAFGADGADVPPVLEKYCDFLKGASVPGLTAEQIGRLQAGGMSAKDISRFDTDLQRESSGQLNAATEKIRAMIRQIDARRKQAEANGLPSLRSQAASLIDGFVTRALKQRSSTFLHAGDLATLADRLTGGIQKEHPDIPASNANDITMSSLFLQCPVCGPLPDDSPHLLYLAAKGALREGLMADTVVAAGIGKARLMEGSCPGCGGHYLIAVFDPSMLPRKHWWKF